MTTTFKLVRRGFLLAAMSLAAFAPQAQARNADAEAFTQRLIDQGVSILRATNDPQRKSKFRDFITQYSDVQRTARFTLGQYARRANPADVSAFYEAFKNFAIATYEARLDKYKGESLKVVNSIETKPGEYQVTTIVDGPDVRNAFRIEFRLSGGNSNYKFFDVSVEGIWLAISQKEEFASYLSQQNGSVPALTANLVARTQSIQSGGK